jgi:hypothetical protein
MVKYARGWWVGLCASYEYFGRTREWLNTHGVGGVGLCASYEYFGRTREWLNTHGVGGVGLCTSYEYSSGHAIYTRGPVMSGAT